MLPRSRRFRILLPRDLVSRRGSRHRRRPVAETRDSVAVSSGGGCRPTSEATRPPLSPAPAERPPLWHTNQQPASPGQRLSDILFVVDVLQAARPPRRRPWLTPAKRQRAAARVELKFCCAFGKNEQNRAARLTFLFKGVEKVAHCAFTLQRRNREPTCHGSPPLPLKTQHVVGGGTHGNLMTALGRAVTVRGPDCD
jgi:hypothetical protein